MAISGGGGTAVGSKGEVGGGGPWYRILFILRDKKKNH